MRKPSPRSLPSRKPRRPPAHGPAFTIRAVVTVFGVLVAINALLAYAPIPPDTQFLANLAMLGLLSLVLFRLGSLPQRTRPPDLPEPDPRIRILLTILLAASLTFRLTTFSPWPLYDETLNGLYALDNLHGWDGRLHYYFSALPPLFIWTLTLFFKILGVGKTALWLLPASLVFLSVLLMESAARRTLGGSEALLVLAFGGFGFWPQQAARFSHPYVLVLFWSALCLWILSFARTWGKKRPVLHAAFLGTALGAGFYTFYSWPVAAAGIGLLFLATHGRRLRTREGLPILATLLTPVMAALIPVIRDAFHGAYEGHLGRLLDLSSAPDLWIGRSLCVTSLFWSHPLHFVFGPVLGGLLNPIEGAVVMTGLVAAALHPRAARLRWILLLLVLLLLPPLLSTPLNFTRMIQVYPLVLFLMVLGSRHLLARLKRPWAWAAALWFLSTALNMALLWGPTRHTYTDPAFWEYHRSPERAAAFDVLERVSRSLGPGRLFMRLGSGDFVAPETSPSLYVLSRPWNALCDPRLSGDADGWVALYTDAHHRPYFQARFPGGEWIDLPPPVSASRGPFSRHVLGIYRRDAFPRGVLEDWEKAERLLYGLYRTSLEHPGYTRDPAAMGLEYVRGLERNRSRFGSDPFLECVYQEQILTASLLFRLPLDRSAFSDAIRGLPYRSPYLLAVKGVGRKADDAGI